jgi:hypothetical protein
VKLVGMIQNLSLPHVVGVAFLETEFGSIGDAVRPGEFAEGSGIDFHKTWDVKPQGGVGEALL